MVDKNTAAGADVDADVTMGLFMYPVLMGADILMFNAHQVPVGRDQIQHIEMARDMAASFNHRYGEHFVLPEAIIDDHVATLPGLDGRKMSKSYDNTIPLFAPREQLKKLIAGIKTDSRTPGEPKDTEGSALFQIYQAFATPEETDALRKAYADGIAWGEAKSILFDRIDREVAPMREKYEHLMAHPEELEALLHAGAAKARQIAMPFIGRLRFAVGLRKLTVHDGRISRKKVKETVPSFKQYKEKDGRFYFKYADASGGALLQSKGFDVPGESAEIIKRLQTKKEEALDQLIQAGWLTLVEGVTRDQVIGSLEAWSVTVAKAEDFPG
jgi:tryptophanyl-tRNA synthetase